MEVAVLNAGCGDFKSEFDTDEELARQQLQQFIGDMLGKGYALFLEDGEGTHRILSYDPTAQSFEVVSSRERKGRAVIRVGEAPTESPAAASGRVRRRVTAVAPGAGG